MFDRGRSLGHTDNHDFDLYLMIDGAIRSPTRISGNIYRFDLPLGRGAIWIGSHSFVPAERDAASRDTRRLGVPLVGIVLSDADRSIEAWHDNADFKEGFHTDEASHRWTNGSGRIPDALLCSFTGATILEVCLATNISAIKAAA
jgi:hypothetical protein